MNPFSCWRAWLAFLDRRERGTSLAFFRIAIGASMLLMLFQTWAAGAIVPLWMDSEYGGVRSISRAPWLVEWLGGPSPGVVQGLYVALFLSSLFLTIGLLGRLSALLTLLLHMNLTGLNPAAGGSYDLLIANACWLLVLAPSTATHHARPIAGWSFLKGIFGFMLSPPKPGCTSRKPFIADKRQNDPRMARSIATKIAAMQNMSLRQEPVNSTGPHAPVPKFN